MLQPLSSRVEYFADNANICGRHDSFLYEQNSCPGRGGPPLRSGMVRFSIAGRASCEASVVP
jgi:hypothetical protein